MTNKGLRISILLAVFMLAGCSVNQTVLIDSAQEDCIDGPGLGGPSPGFISIGNTVICGDKDSLTKGTDEEITDSEGSNIEGPTKFSK